MTIWTITGDYIKLISTESHHGVAVYNDKCYACRRFSSQIDVYGCSDWQLLCSIQLPDCDNHCSRHTITVSAQQIKVCCLDSDRLIILSLDGKVKSIHGPKIEIENNYSDATNRDGSVKSRLCGPILCQEDEHGNLIIANFRNNRLLIFTADCMWYAFAPDAGLSWPDCTLWLNGRLYAISWSHKSITLFEWSHAHCMFGKHSDCEGELYKEIACHFKNRRQVFFYILNNNQLSLRWNDVLKRKKLYRWHCSKTA